MPNVITSLLDQLAGLLGPLSPFTKAVVPAALSVATAAVTVIVALVNGTAVDATPLEIAGAGLILSLVAYLLPNKPAAKPVPVAPAPTSAPPAA